MNNNLILRTLKALKSFFRLILAPSNDIPRMKKIKRMMYGNVAVKYTALPLDFTPLKMHAYVMTQASAKHPTKGPLTPDPVSSMLVDTFNAVVYNLTLC